MTRTIVHERSGAILFKKDGEQRKLEDLFKKVSELEKKVKKLEKVNKELQSNKES